MLKKKSIDVHIISVILDMNNYVLDIHEYTENFYYFFFLNH